jgi:hypothetical protein
LVKWPKEAAKKKERNEWLASGERILEIKPNLRKTSADRRGRHAG